MAQVNGFTFNPFAENTYILHDDTKECVIIDPGCYYPEEREELLRFISDNQLKPVRLLNTHCHIDHIFGNKMVAEKFDLGLETHRGEVGVLEAAASYGAALGVELDPSPMPTVFLDEGDSVQFGNTTLEVMLTPGHSPASICFYNRAEAFIIAGDVLFKDSIGRYDLPGGNLDTLMKSINEVLYKLDDDVVVCPGHGPTTTIGAEKSSNPFVLAYNRGEPLG